MTPVLALGQNYIIDLNNAVNNWNTYFGSHVRITDWEYIGTINDEIDKESTVQQIINPSRTYVTFGNPLEPETVSAILLSEALVDAPPETLTEWETVVRNNVNVGQHKVEISWEFVTSGITFTTIMIANDDEITFDSMFITAVLIKEKIASKHIRICWLWQDTYEDCSRGQIDAELTPKCDDCGNLISCDKECDAWMTLGEAKIECNTEQIAGNCCKLNYGYAWRTPTGSINIKWNDETLEFEITVTGLGSSGMGSGSQTHCCPPRPPTCTEVTWTIQGGGKYINDTGVTMLRIDLGGSGDTNDFVSFSDIDDIQANFNAFNFSNRTMIQLISFSSVQGAFLNGDDFVISAKGTASVNKTPTEINFNANKTQDLIHFEIRDVQTGALIADGTGENQRSSLEMTITQP